jgi:hypothetical protein
MKKNYFKLILATVLLAAGCTKKLELLPTNDITPQNVYKNAAGYKQALAKLYGAFALTGNQGATGSPDIPSADHF